MFTPTPVVPELCGWSTRVMKVFAGILTLFIFCYWVVPFVFSAMKQHDYDNLFHGMQDARRNGGLSYDKHEVHRTYSDRYSRGE